MTAVAFWAGIKVEISRLRRSSWLIILVLVQAVTFFYLVSLFGLTGSRAPVAIVSNDRGGSTRAFIDQLSHTHHSFAIKQMGRKEALSLLHQGKLVAIITIPENFSASIGERKQVFLDVEVDNVNTDMTEDIQRALPSAIVAFGKKSGFDGIRVQSREHDLIDHDTGYIEYMVVSALPLAVFVIAGILSAIAVAEEFEKGTMVLLAVSPVHPLVPMAGRLAVTSLVSFLAAVLAALVAILGYGIHPLHPFGLSLALLVLTVLFTCVGAATGALFKSRLPVISFIFGLSVPLYAVSGLEPERFDGDVLWRLAHISPVYYAVGVVEYLVHGFMVTPESFSMDCLSLMLWAVLTFWFAFYLLGKEVRR